MAPSSHRYQIAPAQLRMARIGLNLRLEDMAAAAGISRNALSAIERGSSNPSVRTLERIVDVLEAHGASFRWESGRLWVSVPGDVPHEEGADVVVLSGDVTQTDGTAANSALAGDVPGEDPSAAIAWVLSDSEATAASATDPSSAVTVPQARAAEPSVFVIHEDHAERLREWLREPRSNSNYVFLIPGNHDLFRNLEQDDLRIATLNNNAERLYSDTLHERLRELMKRATRTVCDHAWVTTHEDAWSFRPLAKTLGHAALEARRELEITLDDAADRIGVSVEFYARIEQGNSLPSVSTLAQMTWALGVSADALIGKAHHPQQRRDLVWAASSSARERADAGLRRMVGRAAHEARKALHITQEDAAQRMNVSVEFYARIERGEALPSLPTFVKMVVALGVSADALLGNRPSS